jgi:GNAT superfamily N-acetyltransferase
MTDFAVHFRGLEERDRGFVIGHWMSSLIADRRTRRRSLAGRGITRRDWTRAEQTRIDELVRDGTTVVACDPDSDGTILYGFACGDRNALHYVFARQTRRRGGLGTALLHELMSRGVVPASHTYATRDGSRWWERAKGAHGQAA